MSPFSFAPIQQAPADPILGLTESFRADSNPNKVNLGIGVYLDETGVSPVLAAVKQAERMWLEEEKTKDYLGMAGAPEFGRVTRELLFGAGHPVLNEARAATLHCPGGTGALRLGADFIHTQFPGATLWLSDPTWPNHNGVFGAAGVPTDSYPYFDRDTQSLRFEEMLAALERVPEGDAVLLHACCHNPTGEDPTPAQWQALAELLARRALLPFLDLAYQGLGNGLEPDAVAVRVFGEAGLSFLVASSFSKNLGLYRERTGALTLVGRDRAEAERVLSRAKLTARANYSNPPAHGGKIVELVLGDPGLRREWEAELDRMRARILGMRREFVRQLKALGVSRDFSFIERQRGIFSFSGIEKPAVLRLRDEFGVYLIENGRVNVAGMTPGNLPYLCGAIAKVLEG